MRWPTAPRRSRGRSARCPCGATTRPGSSSTGSGVRTSSRPSGCSRPGRERSRASTPRSKPPGYPMGPFRLLDLIGLDVDLAIDQRLPRGVRRSRPVRAAGAPATARRGGATRPEARAGGSTTTRADGSAAGARSSPVDARTGHDAARRGRDRGAARARGRQRGLSSRRGRRRPAAGHRRGDAARCRATRPVRSSGSTRSGSGRSSSGSATSPRRPAERSGDQYRVAPLLWHMATV